MALHAVPHQHIGAVTEFFKPLREARNRRNRLMVNNINALIEGVDLDFDADVFPLSMAHDGGSVTERHLMFALVKKVRERYDALEFLQKYDVPYSEKARTQLCDKDNPFWDYDLLGVFKSGLIPKVYVDATDECPPVSELIRLSKQINSISAYAYLGDVTDSVTGDKSAQKFEDDYLDLLFEEISAIGFEAVTYMPSRNTMEQLTRVRERCERYKLMQISGEDINSPRQTFICEALSDPMFSNLVDATWALIKHENDNTIG